MSALSVAIYAPSGFAQDPSALDRAVTCLAGLGCNVHVDASALARHTRFAGTDDERLAAVLRVAAMPGVNVALALRASSPPPAFREERREQRAALVAAHAGRHRRVMVEPRLGEQVDDRSARPRLRVGRSEDDA